MSVHGYSPAVSDTSVPSATSSSHQPPEKQLKALDEKEEAQSTPRHLTDSTDEEREGQQTKQVDACAALPESGPITAFPVPFAPQVAEESAEQAEEGRHEADDFVPNRQRENTLQESQTLHES